MWGIYGAGDAAAARERLQNTPTELFRADGIGINGNCQPAAPETVAHPLAGLHLEPGPGGMWQRLPACCRCAASLLQRSARNFIHNRNSAGRLV